MWTIPPPPDEPLSDEEWVRREDDEIAVQRRSFWALAFVAAFVLTSRDPDRDQETQRVA